MEQTENYYTGCASATETVSEIRDDLEQYREKASDETRYFSMIQKLADTRNDLSWDSHSTPFPSPLEFPRHNSFL